MALQHYLRHMANDYSPSVLRRSNTSVTFGPTEELCTYASGLVVKKDSIFL